MDTVTESKSPIITTPPQGMTGMQIVAGILLFLACIASAFAGGYYLHTLTAQPGNPELSPSPAESSPPSPVLTGDPLEGTGSISGKEYYEDTVFAVATTIPHKILIATVTRQETANGATQGTRSSYFDGTGWTRKLASATTASTAIYPNNLVTDWKVVIDPSRVLKQTVTGAIKIDDKFLSFDTGVITNDIAVRSLPGYTKFISTGTGKLNIDGASDAAKILYTRIYSNNSQELQFYDSPFAVTTHWIAFWDTKGNVFHIDATDVAEPTDKYQTHHFGVMVDAQSRVTKTFDVAITTSSENPPQSYTITLGSPIHKTITFSAGVAINKALTGAYSWFMSEGTGDVDGVSGYGVAEYIHH